MQPNPKSAPVMERVKNNPGIYRRGSRYVVVWQHKGRQHKSFHRTLAEAREAKGQRQAGERTPVTRQSFEDYARDWLEGYAGRTNRGFSKASRADYRRALEQHAVPFFRGWKLADIEPRDVRRLVTELERKGLAPRACSRTSCRSRRCSLRRSRTAPCARTRLSACA